MRMNRVQFIMLQFSGFKFRNSFFSKYILLWKEKQVTNENKQVSILIILRNSCTTLIQFKTYLKIGFIIRTQRLLMLKI